MASFLKQRLVGAIVLISLGIIFIPMLLTGRSDLSGGQPQSNVPPKPAYEIEAPVVLPMKDGASEQPAMQSVQDDEPASPGNQFIAAESKAPDGGTDTTTAESGGDDRQSETAITTTSINDKTARNDGEQRTASAQTAPSQTATQPATELSTTTAKKEISAEQEHITTASETEKPAMKPPVKVAKTEKQSATQTAAPKPVVSGWVVQLGSFAVEKNALQLRDKLRKNGHASFVETYQHEGKTRYRVRVGPEQTRDLANQLKTRLKQETQLSGLVMSFPE